MKTLAAATFSLLCAFCTEASADCRDEVAAAFERLRTSGRPYRKEVTSDISDPFVVGDRKTLRGTAEFLPPERMRETLGTGITGYGTAETIRIGQRAWSNWAGGWPWGWREWDFRLRDRWRDVARDGPGDGANGTPGLTILDRAPALVSGRFVRLGLVVNENQLLATRHKPIHGNCAPTPFQCLVRITLTESASHLQQPNHVETCFVSHVIGSFGFTRTRQRRADNAAPESPERIMI